MQKSSMKREFSVNRRNLILLIACGYDRSCIAFQSNPWSRFASGAPTFMRPHRRHRCSQSVVPRFMSSQDVSNRNETLADVGVVIKDQIDEEDGMERAQFGEVVAPKYLQKRNDSPTESAFALNDVTTKGDSAVSNEATKETTSALSKNVVVAIASVSLALLQYFWQFTHPVSPLTLLADMQERSPPLSVIANNGKPTVVDFWAPWCENCKLAAPTLYQLEQEYEGKVNFCMVNGDLQASWPAIEALGVDAIPHLALVEADGTVETALIGPVPASVLRADLDVLLKNSQTLQGDGDTAAERKPLEPLPYAMLDVFKNRPELRKVTFD